MQRSLASIGRITAELLADPALTRDSTQLQLHPAIMMVNGERVYSEVATADFWKTTKQETPFRKKFYPMCRTWMPPPWRASAGQELLFGDLKRDFYHRLWKTIQESLSIYKETGMCLALRGRVHNFRAVVSVVVQDLPEGERSPSGNRRPKVMYPSTQRKTHAGLLVYRQTFLNRLPQPVVEVSFQIAKELFPNACLFVSVKRK